MAKFIGIDPGLSGGMAVISGDTVETTPMLITEVDVLSWLRDRISPSADTAVIEEVSGYLPEKGRMNKAGEAYEGNVAPGSRMFKFGQSYGGLRMALVACGLEEDVSFFTVRPQAWQKRLNAIQGFSFPPRMRKAGETKPQFKARLKKAAESLFAGQCDRITLKTCDALLIAKYCELMYKGKGGRQTLWE